MGRKLDPLGTFPRHSYQLFVVPGSLLLATNIWNQAESGPLRGHAEGKDVT